MVSKLSSTQIVPTIVPNRAKRKLPDWLGILQLALLVCSVHWFRGGLKLMMMILFWWNNLSLKFPKISKQFGVDSTSNTDKHIQVNTAVNLGGSKGSDSVIPEVCRPKGDSILKNVDIAKSPGKHAASGVSKVNDVQNPPAPHVDSSDHYVGGCVTPRVTHSASATTRARYSDEGNIDLIVSQSEHRNSGLDDSENNEYNDADRFFIKSRVADAGENASMACFSVASHDSTMLTHRFVVDAFICDLGKLADMAVLREGGVLCDDENSDSRILTNECKDKRSGPLSESDGINLLGSGMTVSDVVSHVAPATVVELAQYNSHYLKRESKDVATECVASTDVSDVIGRSPQENTDVHVSKKQRKPSPKRKIPKANGQATRSSPRFTAKQSVKLGANMESEAATSNAASVQEIGLNHGVSSDSTPTEVIGKLLSVAAQSSPPIKRRLSTRLRIRTPVSDAYILDGAYPVRAAAKVYTSDGDIVERVPIVKEPMSDIQHSGPGEDDVQIIYVTPEVQRDPPFSPPCITPGTRLRVGRVIQPSKFLLPPYVHISSTPEQDELYQQVIKHKSDSKDSKIKGSMFLQIKPMWLTTGDLADSITGELSNTVAEIGISVLQDYCDQKKIIFPWILTVYLLDHKFSSRILEHQFRRDDKYILSHKNVLMFPVLQDIGTVQKPRGHWYAVSLNFNAKRFEVLDSARGRGDVSLIEHASSLVEAIKCAYRVNYAKSSKQIDDYQLEYIDVPKQNNSIDCGIFMLKFLELWDGRVVPAITYDQIP